jgi:hypothetical protein
VTRRVDLPDGQWADLVERLNHAQRQRIRFASSKGLDNVTEGIAAMLIGWHVLDVDGIVIPVPSERTAGGYPSAILDTFPSDVVDELAEEVARIVTGQPDPLGSAGTSQGSAPDPGSPSSPSLPTPTSLPITPAGRGRTSSHPLPS